MTSPESRNAGATFRCAGSGPAGGTFTAPVRYRDVTGVEINLVIIGRCAGSSAITRAGSTAENQHRC
jgi:hypothetical protein